MESINYVYGLKGICELFNCSKATAMRLKNGAISGAVAQVGRKIIVNKEEALRLAGMKK